MDIIEVLNKLFDITYEKLNNHFYLQESILLMKAIEIGARKHIKNIKDKQFEEFLKSYDEKLKALEKSGKKFDEHLLEMIYINIYQSFEYFLENCFKLIYKAFPKFLISNQKNNKITTNYYDVFEIDDILYSRDKIINEKVKTIMFSNNILDILKHFKIFFGKEIILDNETKNKLILISKNRNVIIHNNGIINDIYIDDLKKFGIKPQYKNGEFISKYLEKVISKDRNFIFETINNIIEFIINHIKQINKYYENIN